jgi:hypothetical protein
LGLLQECADANRGRVGKQDINSLLIQPVQRIPRYLLLLRELAKHTEPDHKDFANINTVRRSFLLPTQGVP